MDNFIKRMILSPFSRSKLHNLCYGQIRWYSNLDIIDQSLLFDESSSEAKFSDIPDLHPNLLKSLKSRGLSSMAKVQKKTFDRINGTNNDLLVSSETGSGKTLAYLLPILNNTIRKQDLNKHRFSPLSLVISPTRELAEQTNTVANLLLKYSNLGSTALVGGISKEKQLSNMFHNCHMVSVTPGRLRDILGDGKIHLRNCQNLVIDEADRMLDMGFEPQIREIIQDFDLPSESLRTLMFSATFPRSIMSLVSEILKSNYETIIIGENAGRKGAVIPKTIKHEFLNVKEKKDGILKVLVKREKTLVFCNTKMEVEYLFDFLTSMNFECSMLSGSMSQRLRYNTLNSFKKGFTNILIATNVAARGLDIPDIKLIINYGVPMNKEDYIHRAGRCGRMGKEGTVYTIDHYLKIKNIKYLLRKHLNEDIY